jgi:hypothetical protein
MGVSGQSHAPASLLPRGKGPPVPIVQEAGWAPESVWTQRLQEESFRLCWGSNLDRPVVQPVARHYTDWATRLISTKQHLKCTCGRKPCMYAIHWSLQWTGTNQLQSPTKISVKEITKSIVSFCQNVMLSCEAMILLGYSTVLSRSRPTCQRRVT